MSSIIQDIDLIRWNSNESTSHILTALGIQHQFSGVHKSKQTDLYWANQVHKTTIIDLKDFTASEPDQLLSHGKLPVDADGIYTRHQSKIAVRTADCIPLIFVNRSKDELAVAHAGWRGLTAGIIPQVIKKFQSSCKDLYAVIGPCISMARFEIGPDVASQFLEGSYNLSELSARLVLGKGNGDRWHANLSMAAALNIRELGIPPQQIEVLQQCTFDNSSKFHSYRREGRGCGSNWTWATL
ncbi:MAG: polyphenol oxidase family protein [Proteobacteria bacterium]|nr:polyphenol oxidase family protein [Pseudomonadota bacterium]